MTRSQQDFSFSYILPTRIEFGDGMIEKLPDFVSLLGIRKPLVITDENVRQIPFFRTMEAALRGASVDYDMFDEVEANPKDTTVHAASEVIRRVGADGIIAIGGGSPIDCAKAVAVTAVNDGPVRRFSDPSAIGGPLLPIIAIPTTAGTGSEITFSSVITDTAERFKFTVKTPAIAPKIALLDPAGTLSMPPRLTSATGLDALTHAVEAYVSNKAGPLSDAMALYAVEIISSNLVGSVEHGDDIEARRNMLVGSLAAGLAFSHADVASVHCIAEALGGMYDLPHGVCNAVFLSAATAYNREYCNERLDRLARAAGVTAGVAASDRDGDGAADGFVRYLADIAETVELPRFRDLGVSQEDFPAIAEAAAANGSNAGNPRPMKKEDYLTLLAAVWDER